MFVCDVFDFESVGQPFSDGAETIGIHGSKALEKILS